MDSRVVSKKIKETIWPRLRERRFSRFSERNAWRYVGDIIHVVNFQSFSSYLAERIGATSYSFSVNVGIYFSQIPRTVEPAFPPKPPIKPHEYECDLRGSLNRTFAQVELSRKDIWFIDAASEYLARSIADAAQQLEAAEEHWFGRYSNLEQTLEMLLSPVMDDPNGPVTGYGNPGSPMRNYKTGYIARAVGKRELACQYLTRAAQHFRAHERLAADIEECGAKA